VEEKGEKKNAVRKACFASSEKESFSALEGRAPSFPKGARRKLAETISA